MSAIESDPGWYERMARRVRARQVIQEADRPPKPIHLHGTMTACDCGAEEANYPCFPYLRISKARALAEVQAKRRILALHDNDPWPCWEAVALAQVYADHPDYRQEWRRLTYEVRRREVSG